MAGATERLVHVAELLPGDLHPRLRDDELRRGRLRDDQHARDAEGDGAGSRRSACGRRSKSSTPATGAGAVAGDQGLIDDPVLIQLCMGIPWGRPTTSAPSWRWSTTSAGWIFSAFSIGRNQLPYVGAGGPCRRQRPCRARGQSLARQGRLATNGALVERAVAIVRGMGARVLDPGRGADEAEAGAAVVDGAAQGRLHRRRRHRRRLGGAARSCTASTSPSTIPHPEAEREVGEVLANAERAFAQLT